MTLALALLVFQTGTDSLATRVRLLADTYLVAFFERHPDEATLDGVANGPHDRLPDNSPGASARWWQREDAWLAELERIDPAPLAGRPEWIAYGIMRDALEGSIAERVCRFDLWSVAHTGGGWLSTVTSLAALQAVGTDLARRQALARARAIPAYIATETANHRAGLRRGYTAPRRNVEIALSEIDTLLATPLEQSPLYDPARRDSTPEFRAELARIIERDVTPAMRRYRAFLANEYVGRARTTIGVSGNPRGRECYSASIRATTGLTLSADSVHRLGLATVQQLEGEMRVIAQRSFGTTDVSALLERLRTDTAYTFRTRDEMLARARESLERARAAAPRWFGRLPRAPVVVEPYPAFRERQSVGEWNPPAEDGSRPGIYYLSTYDPMHKSRADLEPLSFHETIPGHHLQGAIALERGNAIPAIARYFWSPGMGEGWAEYAEQLAEEMGLYSSDTARLGAIADITLSATLLVVDTGIHAFGWSRQKSIDYIRNHTRVPLLRAEVGVDRYPVWPAQGLSYGLGRLEIRRLRDLAEQALGAKFDIKAFHDRVLENGAIPLPVLRSHIERWLSASARREPVLKQVDVPHPYYWREMYVPQVTSGPSSVTWSPDGTELIYSMQGTLWRQRIGSVAATQITSGPFYDYQPDWSPDGRSVVFVRYARDMIELELLDLASGTVTPLTANGAVNLEPRWSPDGTRIAFVSTLYNRRWHIFVLSPEGAKDPLRLTEDNDSKLPRYYYSKWDHYLSPAWSPDGKEIVLVSNRGHIHGTGGFWRMEARPGAPLRELRYEETTWKARPDWSPDGTRIVYSSYLGRQWNQLWLMTTVGGDPLPLTYGEFDRTAPRWSRDGTRIACISNEGGNTSLWVIDVVGGKNQPVEARERRYGAPVGTLRVNVVDRAGRPLPARVSVTTGEGRGYAPDDAWRHADEAFDRSERQFEYPYFHSTGSAELTVPAGRVQVDVWRGPEYRVSRAEVTVPAGGGQRVVHRVVLDRLANLPAQGWWSGDLHVHMNYGGAYRNTPRQLAFQARAEDLHVVENLIVNKEQRIPDITYFRVAADPVSSPTFLLMHAQEFHTSVWGHMGLLGLRSHYLLPDYAGYPNTPAASWAPTNATVADLAHAQGGGALVGYVHPFDTRPDPADTTTPLNYELPVDVALGKVDYLEVMGYSDHLITSEIWYRLLNCGFRIPAGAGTDAFPNFASLRGPPGLARVFVQSGAVLEHRRWLAGLKAGRTFVTNAPLLEFSLAGRAIGDEIRLAPGSHRLTARVGMRSNVPIDHLEIVGNGKVVATIPLRGERMTANDTVSIPVTGSGWYVLRAYSDRATMPVLDLYPFGSTSAIYVRVGDEPVRSPEDAAFFVHWIERIEAATRASTAWNTPGEQASALHTLAEARAVFENRPKR